MEDLRDGSAMSVIMDSISFLPRMRGRLRAKRAGRGKYQLAQSKPAPSTALTRGPLPPHFVRGRMLTRRQQHRAAFAEADARIILFGAKAFEDDLVAVLDEAALLAGRQRDRLAPARGKFEEAAPAILLRPGHGARADEIADDEIAAVAGVMRDHLRHGPIRRRERSAGQRAAAPCRRAAWLRSQDRLRA